MQSHEDLDVIRDAATVVGANVGVLIVFVAGPRGLEALGADGLAGGFYSLTGPTFVTTVVYLAATVASVTAAALSLTAVVIPISPPSRWLRASGALLGATFLVLMAHAVLVFLLFVETDSLVRRFGGGILLAVLAGGMLIVAWRRARSDSN